MANQKESSTMNTSTRLDNLTLATGDLNGPTNRSYWILEGKFAAGAYPGKERSGIHELDSENIKALENSGIEVFVNLTQDYEGGTDAHLDRYDAFLSSNAVIERFPIPDVSVPPADLMEEILQCVDAHLIEGRAVYVHCWGGLGRAGSTVACWLMRHGYTTADDVIDTLADLRRGDRGAGHQMSPQTPAQCEFVLAWQPLAPARNLDAEFQYLTDEDWEAGEPCPHGCGQWVNCAHRNATGVFATKTGNAYHATKDCKALKSGQEFAESKGFSTDIVQPIPKGLAQSQGKQPCLVCMGQKK